MDGRRADGGRGTAFREGRVIEGRAWGVASARDNGDADAGRREAICARKYVPSGVDAEWVGRPSAGLE